MNNIILIINLSILIMIVLAGIIIMLCWKSIIKKMVTSIGKILLTDVYEENLIELFPGIGRFGIQKILENSLRATSGEVLQRPLGSTKAWPNFDYITFIPAQTSPFPIDSKEMIDISVTIGPLSKKPMKLDIPLMISAMGYGVGISEYAKVALASAATKAKTAINSGEGGFLPEERQAADKFILQISKNKWAKEEEIIQQADMIELKLGQGAAAGIGAKMPADMIPGRARKLMDLEENEDAIMYEQFVEKQTLTDIKELVDDLRELTKGVPIGVKIMAGGKIEEDLDNLIGLGIDFIAIDGGQAATRDAPTITQDDFGIPTLHAVVRAAKHLEKRGVKKQISLIVSGGLGSPGEYLKAIALGADAIYLGSAVLFAMTHTQNLKVLPWEPPTQVVWYNGQYQDQLNVEEATTSAYNFLISSSEEMKVGLRAMGKRSLKELTKDDLNSYDKLTANMIGIPFSFEAYSVHNNDYDNEEKKEKRKGKGWLL